MSDSLRGQFLIAAKHLRDNNFFKAVVLMLEHSDEGAMGVVINHPMDVSVSSALSKHFEMSRAGQCLLAGGPVEENALLILHNSCDYDQEHDAIVPGVFVGTSPDVFERVVESSLEEHDDDSTNEFEFRIYAGYSGWGAGQLEQEMGRGDWFSVPASADFVFEREPYQVWEDALKLFHKRKRLLPDQPANPEWN
jgi:putative transcriptional regulator